MKNSEFKVYIKNMVSEIKKLLKNPKALFKVILPSLIIAVIWTVLTFLEMAYPKSSVIRIFSFFTYSQGGMFGGFFGALGGIVGKTLFAYLLCAIVNDIVNKRKIKIKEIFVGFKLSGFSVLGYFLIGAGGSMLLYLVMNITSSEQNAMIGVAGAVMIVMAAGQKNSLILMMVCGIEKLLTRGKGQSQMTVSHVISGMTAGFILAVPLSLPRSAWICPIVCAAFLAVGIVLLICRNSNGKAVASASVLLLILFPLATSSVMAADGDEKSFPLDASDIYTYVCLHDSDDKISIEVKNPQMYSDLQYTTVCLNTDFGAAINGFESMGGSKIGFRRTVPMSDIEETHLYGSYYHKYRAYDSLLLEIVPYQQTSYDNAAAAVDAVVSENESKWRKDYTIGENYEKAGYENRGYDNRIIHNSGNGRIVSGYYHDVFSDSFKNADITAATTTSYVNRYTEYQTALYVLPEELGLNDTLPFYIRITVSGNWEINGACTTNVDNNIEQGLQTLQSVLKGLFNGKHEEFFGDYEKMLADLQNISFNPVITNEITEEGKTVLGISGTSPSGEEDDNENENDIIKGFGGVLYKPNETRKGVILKDYDGDGDIDYLDRVIQYELIHDPDYLTRNGTAGAVIVAITSILTGILGGAVGAVAGVAASSAGTTAGADGGTVAGSLDTLSPYIKFDGAGDIEWTDPTTGKITQYIRQDNGKYKNPLTDMEYSYDELYESAEYRERNAEGFCADAETAERNVEEQRAVSGGLSENAREYAEIKRQLEREAADQDKMIRLANKYNLPNDMEKDDFIEAVLRKMDEEKARGNKFAAQGNCMAMYEKGAETVSTAADLAMDGLATATGPVGKAINAAYKVGKGAASKGAEEANYSDGNVAAGIVQGVFEGGIDAAADFLGGKAKAAATVAGEAAKGGVDAYRKGESITEGMVQGAKKGAVNAAIDAGTDAIGEGLKNNTSVPKGIPVDETVYKNTEKAVGAIDAGTSLADNLGKKAAEKSMKDEKK